MELQREKIYKADIEMVCVENQNGKRTAIGAKFEGLELLTSYPDGKFKVLDNFLTGSDILNGFRSGDELTVKKLQYRGNYVIHFLSFEEYINLGRPKSIEVKEKTIIT